MIKINIGQKVICYDKGIIGTVIRSYYNPIIGEDQTIVEDEDGRTHHATTSTLKPYKDGFRTSFSICDEFATSTNVSEKITLTVPNRDTYLGPCTLCTKEVLQKSYTDKIGSIIDFCGRPKKVVSVKITEDSIFVELE